MIKNKLKRKYRTEERERKEKRRNVFSSHTKGNWESIEILNMSQISKKNKSI